MGKPPATITHDITAIANMVENVFSKSPMVFTPPNQEVSTRQASHVTAVNPPRQPQVFVASYLKDIYELTVHPAKKLKRAS
jgi:hypothetical protein